MKEHERYERLKSVFLAAVEATPAARAEVVAQSCADDLELRRDVEELLRRDGSDSAPLPLATADAKTEVAEMLVDLKSWDRFVEVAPIGQGGMGVVFRARDPFLKRDVAIKLLRQSAVAGADRFRREAEAQARVDHPHVLDVYEAGLRGDRPFIVMRFVDGWTLADLPPELSVTDRVELMRQVADGVEAAHAGGLVHRDIKPSNVLVESLAGRLRAFIADFGIAVAVGGPRTTGAMILGSPAYLAPERIAAPALDADPRSDVYGIGATFYHVFTGTAPFHGDSAIDVLLAVRTETPARLRTRCPDVSEEVEAVVMKCMARDPAQRYPTALSLRDDLQRTLNGETPHALFEHRARTKPGPLVALLGVSAGDSAAAAIAPAVLESWRDALTSRPRLQVVAAERLARALQGLNSAVTTPDDEIVARIERHFGACGVVGATLRSVSGRWQLLVHIAGREPVPIEERHAAQALVGLGLQAADLVCVALGLRDSGDSVLSPIALSPEAAGLYARGRERLWHFDARRAIAILGEAVAAQPDHPILHATLAQAYAALGYDSEALAAADAARARAHVLGPDPQAEIRALHHELRSEWSEVVAIRRLLTERRPDDIEAALNLAESLVQAGRPADALAAVADLRTRLEGSEPRLDLIESAAATVNGDFEQARAAAARAVALGIAIGAPHLVAMAKGRESQALRNLGRYREALVAAREERTIRAASGDRTGAADATLRESGCLRILDELELACKGASEALATMRAVGHKRGTLNALNTRANTYLRLGRLDQARADHKEANALAREIGDRRLVALTTSNLGRTNLDSFDFAAAIEAFEEALADYRALGDRKGIAAQLLRIATVADLRGELARASTLLLESLEIFRSLGKRADIGAALHNLGFVLFEGGQLVAAEDMLVSACDELAATDSRVDQVICLGTLAVLQLARGGVSESSAQLDRARAIAVSVNDGPNWIHLGQSLGQLHFERDNTAEAIAVWTDARDRARRGAGASYLVDIELCLARVSVEAGHWDLATEQLRDAEVLARGAGMQHRLAECLTLRARVASGCRQEGDAQALIAAAHAIPLESTLSRIAVALAEAQALAAIDPTRALAAATLAHTEAERRGLLVRELEAALVRAATAPDERAAQTQTAVSRRAHQAGLLRLARLADIPV